MFSLMSKTCVFCEIVKKSASADIKFENDEIMVFTDIKPAAKHHYLAIPKEHIPNVNYLITLDHKALFGSPYTEKNNNSLHYTNTQYEREAHSNKETSSNLKNFKPTGTNHNVERLISEGKRVLQDQGGDLNDSLLGFHMPPFNTVGHLHLHIISPASTLNLLHRTMFKPNTWWFEAVDKIQEKLEELTGGITELNNKL